MRKEKKAAFRTLLRGYDTIHPVKTYFRKTQCPQCRHVHDPIEMTCPYCGHADPQARDFHYFDHQVRDSWPRQIIYFAIGLLGLRIIATIAMIPFEFDYISSHQGSSIQEIQDYLLSAPVEFPLMAITYSLLFGIFLLVFLLTKRFPRVFTSFKDPKQYLFGLIGFAGIFGLELLYSKILNLPPNQNEKIIRDIVALYPAGSLIIFGLVGPFVEEITYRVGLFGFLGRLGKVLAYVLSAIIFGAIHFNWEALWTPELQATIGNEFLALPGYVGAGLALAFLYDRFGLAASFTAHALNNIVSLSIQIISGGQQ